MQKEFADLATLLGEEPRHAKTEEMFGTLDQFMNEVIACIKENEKAREDKLRKEKRKRQKESLSPQKSTPVSNGVVAQNEPTDENSPREEKTKPRKDESAQQDKDKRRKSVRFQAGPEEIDNSSELDPQSEKLAGKEESDKPLLE